MSRTGTMVAATRIGYVSSTMPRREDRGCVEVGQRRAAALAFAAALTLFGCGKTARESELDDAKAGGAGQAGSLSSSSPFGGTGSSSGSPGVAGAGGSSGAAGMSGSDGPGGRSNEQGPEDQDGLGSPLSPEKATLQPAGCPEEVVEDECEVEAGEGTSRLVTLRALPAAFDAVPEQQIFGVCRTVYVQPRGGCVQPLGVTQSTIRSVIIAGDSYAIVQPESIRLVDGQGIVRAGWQAPRGGIWPGRVPPVVVSGSVIDFFVGDELLELDPQTGETRVLAANPSEDVGAVLALGEDVVWSVGQRRTGSVPTFTPTGVERFVRQSGQVVRESDLACESLATDGTFIYCTTWHSYERWRPGEPPEADTLAGGGELRFGPGLLARGSSLYRSEDPATAVGALEAPPFWLASGSAYYPVTDEARQRVSLYRATLAALESPARIRD